MRFIIESFLFRHRIEFFQSMWDQLAHERAKNEVLKRKIERLEKV